MSHRRAEQKKRTVHPHQRPRRLRLCPPAGRPPESEEYDRVVGRLACRDSGGEVVRLQHLLSEINTEQRPGAAAHPEVEALDAYSQAVIKAVETVGAAVVSVGMARRAPGPWRRRGGPGVRGPGRGVITTPDGVHLTNNPAGR